MAVESEMAFTKIPCIFHPVVLLVLDDDPFVQKAMRLLCEANQQDCITTDSAEQAQTYLNQSCQQYSPMVIRVDESEGRGLRRTSSDWDVSDSIKVLLDPHRFDYIGVSIADYDLGDVTGLSVYENTKNKKVYKILFSGVASKDDALAAYAKHDIDQYFPKGVLKNGGLVDEIHQGKQEYFARVSKLVRGTLPRETKNLLDSAEYQKLFYTVFKQANAVEFYILDNLGSFCFADKDGHLTWLIIRNQSEYDKLLAALESHHYDEKLIHSLQKREKLAFFLTDEDEDNITDALKDYLFDAHHLFDGYYYSVISGKIKTHFPLGKVVSYHDWSNKKK